MYQLLLIACSLFIIVGCGNSSSLSPVPSKGNLTPITAPALAYGWVTTMNIPPNAHVGQPFDVVFSVTSPQNTSNTTLRLKIPPSITVVSGTVTQTNGTLVALSAHEITFTLKIDNLSEPLPITFVADGGYADGSYAVGSVETYFIEQNGFITTTNSLAILTPTRDVNQLPPPVTGTQVTITSEPYPVDDIDTTPQPRSR